jgi:hypothetical protein
MNPEIKKALVMLAAYYEKVLSPEQIEIYSNQLAENLTPEETLQACKMYIAEPANEFFPRPVSKLIALIKKPVSNEDQAANIASAIMNAYVDHGYRWNVPTHGHIKHEDGLIELGQYFKGKDTNYLQWDHAALSVFGPVGLEIVNRYGGWTSFCEIAKDTLDGVIRAQIKTLALSLMNTHERTGSFGLSLSPSGSVPLLSGQNLIQLANIKTIKE